MNLIDLMLLAIALGIDCLVVSFSQGLIFTENKLKNSLNLAIAMGLFQGLFPFIGYFGTDYLYNLIVPYSNKIVFLIFFILGGKFIIEAFEKKEEAVKCIGLKCLIGLGVATSIDALVSGSTLCLTKSNIFIATFLIGIVSFLMSITGFWIGNRFKHIPSRCLEILGGLILVILAFKTLVS